MRIYPDDEANRLRLSKRIEKAINNKLSNDE
jgi:hypothetical protein